LQMCELRDPEPGAECRKLCGTDLGDLVRNMLP